MINLAMPMGIFTDATALILPLIPMMRSVACCVCSVTNYILSILIMIIGLITSFVLIILFCNLMQTLLGSIPSEHFILRYLEKRIKAKLKAIRRKEKRAARLIRKHLNAIDQRDGASAQLLVEIRAAEAIIRTKVWDWKAVPDRHPRSKTAGSAFFVHGRFASRPLEAPEPSAWSIVRWWRNEEDPRLWAAKAKLAHKRGVLSDKRAVFARLKRENKDLTAKRNEAIRKRDAVQWGPCQRKPTNDKWAEKHLSVKNCPVAARQPTPAQRQTNFFHRDVDLTKERVHYCEFCGKDGHRWRHQYDLFADAEAAPFVCPCPTAAACMRTRPAFVSAGAVGGPSFFDPDVVVAPQGPPQAFNAPPSLFVAPNFSQPASLFAATSAPFVSAQATGSFSSVVPAQISVPKVSVPEPASAPPSAPEVNFVTPSSAPSAAPVATLPNTPPPPATATDASAATATATATAATVAAAPVFKTAPAAPTGKGGPPSAIQIVWPGQNPAGVSSASPAIGESLMSRPSFTPAPGIFAASSTSDKSSHEKTAAALVKEEAEARALEKAAAKRQKKNTSAPQVEKNYRF